MTTSMHQRAMAYAAILAALTHVAVTEAWAAKPKPEWSQVENVKDAAKRLGDLQRRQGADAALKFLEACYKTHTIAEKYTEGLEACMAQDYMLSQVLAVIYSRMPPDALKAMKAPTADIIARSMRGRFQAIFQQYKFTQEQADGLKKAVDQYGMPIFVKSVFPNRGSKDKPDDKGAARDKDAPAPMMPPVPQLKPEDAPDGSAQPPAGGEK